MVMILYLWLGGREEAQGARGEGDGQVDTGEG